MTVLVGDTNSNPLVATGCKPDENINTADSVWVRVDKPLLSGGICLREGVGRVTGKPMEDTTDREVGCTSVLKLGETCGIDSLCKGKREEMEGWTEIRGEEDGNSSVFEEVDVSTVAIKGMEVEKGIRTESNIRGRVVMGWSVMELGWTTVEEDAWAFGGGELMGTSIIEDV